MATILVTEDDSIGRDAIRLTLERDGHVVESVANVDAALDALQKEKFDLIVSDYEMPGKTGLDLLLQLRREGLNIPFLMVSACVDSEIEAATKRLGASGLLCKPFRRQELTDRISRAITPHVKEEP
jgi:CheY-like chemotaxis protein